MFRFKALVFSILFLLSSTGGVMAQQEYNVLKFGAKNDSSKLATDAIRKAIDAASKKGGGTIYFPAGKYLTGPIHFKSNITIYLEAGAELHFSDNFDHYLPMVESRYEGVDVTSFSPLFYANKVNNIAIRGRGLIDGHGKKWWYFVEGYKADQPRSSWQLMFDSLNKNILLPDDPKQMKRGFLRPPFFQAMHSSNILIEGVTIQNSPFWTINPEFCDNVTVHAVTIFNPKSPNTDGINAESCRNVHISDCHISVGDDCITIKSGKDLPGRTKNTPAENYTITNCTMLSGHGGVVIGSEMSGGVRKIAISNCVFDGTDRGIRLKTVRGRGGVVEEIRVSNIVMNNIRDQAIVLDMEYAKSSPEPVSERTPAFRNMHFSNITAQTNVACFINGIEEMPVENISFSNINMIAKEGFVMKNAKDIRLNNVSINTVGSIVKAENIDGLELFSVRNEKPLVEAAVIKLKDVSNAFVHGCWPVPGTKKFIDITGSRSRNILVKNNNIAQQENNISAEANSADKLIKIEN